MTDTRQILVALISMATFLQAIKAYCDKHLHENSASQRNDFTDLGEQMLNKHIWKCYLPSPKMGKNREINTIEATSLLENVKHIDDIHLVRYYKNMPIKKLEDTFITVVFCNHENDKVTEQLKDALFIKSIIKRGARNGSIDSLKQEVLFKNTLKKGEKISDYNEKSSKHPFVSFLGVNTRTLKSFGGGKNEKK